MRRTVIFLAALCSVSAQFFGRANRIMNTSATCNENSIFFRLNFEFPFVGLIYTENQWPQCIYVNGSANPKATYDVDIPLRGCNTVQLASGALENAVIVQSDPRVLEATDRKFLLNCHPRNYGGGDASFTVAFGGVTVESDLSSTEVVTGSGTATQLDYTVEIVSGRGPSGPLVRRPLSVGEEISYVVRIPDTRGADVRIGTCWARDGISSIQLSDERGCSLQDTSNNIWNSFTAQTNGNERVFWNYIRAWAFPTSNKVDIFCNLHVCVGSCPVYQCRRLRRDAKMMGEESTIVPLEGSFQVVNLATIDVLNAEFSGVLPPPARVVTGDIPQERDDSVKQEICITRLHFGIGLAVALLGACLMVMITLICGFRTCMRSSKSGKASSTRPPARLRS